MKVLHLCRTNLGGAGRVAQSLHEECLRQGHRSALLVRGDHYRQGPGVLPLYSRRQNALLRLRRKLRQKLGLDPKPQQPYLFFQTDERQNWISAKKIVGKLDFQPDVVAVYWISEFLNYASLGELHAWSGARICFMLTDMGAYTGGCHYAWSCTGYHNDCGSCPALPRQLASRAALNLRLRKQSLEGLPIRVLASRGQSMEMAQRSSLFAGRDIVPNLYKVGRQSPELGQAEARMQLGLPEEGPVWLVGSERFNDPRKGMSLLLNSLNQLDFTNTQQPLIVLIGTQTEEWAERLALPHRILGRLDFSDELPLAFLAADLHLSASVMDTGPFMINLAIFYGCPVVAFPVGVAKHFLAELGCGIAAPTIDEQGYVSALEEYLSLSPNRRKLLADRCRETARKLLYGKEDDLEYLFGFGE